MSSRRLTDTDVHLGGVEATALERNLTDPHPRVHRGAYRATPSRRTYIPKADGRRRPLAVAALEDKIVQRATVAVLNCIYEEERSEEHTSELQSLRHLVCRLLLEKKKRHQIKEVGHGREYGNLDTRLVV